ncbi:hypothetical protein MGAST_26255 [Mycobacterium gastri 'Wayne']|uniref:Uncharacterized protein n=1 Tax=Mycobacterium gastri TaxID=1777 RepID=A0A1X1VDB6_MYCGS|nr:hypothetical protein MGAST_26255 [Mycobacterium gastri 'Wayne']ORV67080.1 hypothetical protein AWC07_09870 [Mycobacterium gastri]
MWLAAAVATAVPAAAVPNTQCALTTAVQEVPSVSQLPPELRTLLPPIADIGAPFNKTDAVTDPSLPFRRLIRAGNRGSDWFVWFRPIHKAPGPTPPTYAFRCRREVARAFTA